MLSPIEIFCCYSHQDQPLLQRLKSHLKLLERQGLITIWSDVDIDAGVEWEREIHTHLNSSQIVLLLVSADFMASDYCYSTEMQRAMQRHEQKEARVIPILLCPTYWKGAPFEKLQFLPTKAKPVTDRSWSEDEALSDVAEQISTVVKELRMQRTLSEAEKLALEKHYEEALLLYEQAITIEPEYALALRGKGEILFKVGSYEESLVALEQSIQADPKIGDGQFYQSKAETLEKLQRYEESLAAYEEALRHDLHNVHLYRKKAVLLERLKRPQEALAIYDQIIRLEPKYVWHYTAKGDLLLLLKRPLQALNAYEQAIQIQSDIALLYYKKGDILLSLKRYEEAIDAYTKAKDTEAHYTDDYMIQHDQLIRIGDAYLALKRYQGALRYYIEGVMIAKGDPYGNFKQGQALFGLERYEEALAAYKQAQVLSSSHPDSQFYHEQGVVYERLAQLAYEEERKAQKNMPPQITSAGDSLSTIPGIVLEIQTKLEANGIHTTQNLLSQTATKEERGDLSQRAGVSTHVLKMLTDRADLMRLQGIGSDIAVMLEEAGVNGCKDLRRRNPEHLYVTLEEEQHSGNIVPSIEQITEWIAEAMAATSSQE